MSDYCKTFVKKYKVNGEIEFAPVYFNSVTKTVINNRIKLENSFQNILYLIYVWINKGSGWMLNQSSLSTLTFPPTGLYQEVLIHAYLLN